jgi:virulence-associated protein VagC
LSDEKSHPLEDTLIFADELPLQWQERSEQSPGESMTRIAEKNERLLRSINLLAEQGHEKPEEEGEHEAALIRLETKVDLLLDLFSRIGSDAVGLPPVAPVRLSAKGMEWLREGEAPDAGQSVWIHLYLEPRLPEAVQFPARILEVTTAGAQQRVIARFETLGEGVQNLLEKMIFRHHRRQVAQQRPASPAREGE